MNNMNHADGGLWLWTVIGVVAVVLLVAVISKLSKKNPPIGAPAK